VPAIDPRNVSLDGLTLDDLGVLRGRIDSQISALQKQHEEEALKKLEALAAELGLTREQIAERFTKKFAKKPRGTAVPPKYRNPQKPSETWAGRGKKPAWVETHLKAGGKLEDLAV
jgi:DNA-binding protein H-NS